MLTGSEPQWSHSRRWSAEAAGPRTAMVSLSSLERRCLRAANRMRKRAASACEETDCVVLQRDVLSKSKRTASSCQSKLHRPVKEKPETCSNVSLNWLRC